MPDTNKSTDVRFIRPIGTISTTGSAPVDIPSETKRVLALEDAGGRVGLLLRAAQQVESGVAPRSLLQTPSLVDHQLHEKVLERHNLLPASFLGVGAARSRAVCKIQVRNATDYVGDFGSWVGSGFLVSRNVLLTNHHVLNSVDAARNATCVFNFEHDEQGVLQATQGFSLNPGRLFVTSKADGGLDFTFVWVDGDPGATFGWVQLDRAVTTIAKNEFANCIQHPDGRPKEVALQENQIIAQDPLVIHYSTDTEPGSSGSPIFSNEWRLVALHHASPSNPNGLPAIGYSGRYVNEGIKPSAISASLETTAEQGATDAERRAAHEALALFRGSDELAGYFGTLGRDAQGAGDVERVVDSYRGEGSDVDVGFWNIEWFNKHYERKMEAVARIILSMNLDIWAFEETSPEATEALVRYLNENARQHFKWAASEPDAAPSKQTTTVMWNSRTVDGEKRAWPTKVDAWFAVRSQDFGSLHLEAVEGPVFPRYPGLFHFSAKNRDGGAPFDFFLVPLHLKAMGEGSKRRRMSSAILAAAVRETQKTSGESDWILGGDFNAELASNDFKKLLGAGHVALSAEDEQDGAMSYVKSPKSLIDHIFLSPNLAQTYGADDFFIVAQDKALPDYTADVSDHRPVLVRLSLRDQTPSDDEIAADGPRTLPEGLRDALGDLMKP